MSVSRVTLVPLVLHHLRSLFMAFPPHLLSALALLSWLLHKTVSVCSFWRRSYPPVFNCEGQLGASFCLVDRPGMVHARIPFRLSLLLFFSPLPSLRFTFFASFFLCDA